MQAQNLQEQEALGDDHLLALPRAIEGFAHYAMADYPGASRVLEEAVPVLEPYELYGDASFMAGALAASRAFLGDFAGAEEWLGRVRDLAERSGDPATRADANVWASQVESVRGDADLVDRYGREALELAEGADHRVCVVGAAVILGDNQLRRQRPERAIPSLERAIEVAQYCFAGPLENRGRALLSVARSKVEEGLDPIAELSGTVERAREFGDRLAEAQILGWRAAARTSLPEPDWEAAFQDFEESLRVFREIRVGPFEARTLREFGRALQASGRPEQGRRRLEQAALLSGTLGLRETLDDAAGFSPERPPSPGTQTSRRGPNPSHSDLEVQRDAARLTLSPFVDGEPGRRADPRTQIDPSLACDCVCSPAIEAQAGLDPSFHLMPIPMFTAFVSTVGPLPCPRSRSIPSRT